jgi:hypothetical protein
LISFMREKVYKLIARSASASATACSVSAILMPGNPNVPSNNQPVNVYGFFGDVFVQQSDDFIQ